MSERDVLERQRQSGQCEFYLVRVGAFLHAYGHGAFALSRATGYRVVRKQRHWGEVLTAGGPVSRLDQVLQMIADAGGAVGQVDEHTWVFRALDGTPDEAMVSKSKKSTRKASADDWLADAIRSFNLSQATPIDAMLFVQQLQQRLTPVGPKE